MVSTSSCGFDSMSSNLILLIFIENLFLMYSKLHLINSMHKMAMKRFLENVSNIAFQYPIQIKGIVSLLYCKMIFLYSLYYKYYFYPFSMNKIIPMFIDEQSLKEKSDIGRVRAIIRIAEMVGKYNWQAHEK